MKMDGRAGIIRDYKDQVYRESTGLEMPPVVRIGSMLSLFMA